MAKPWTVVGQSETADGVLELRRRGDSDFLILIDNRVLMNSSANRSEMALAELACAAIGGAREPRVLIGGLGMGFTLRAALDNLPEQAEVVVAELNPVVEEWCRGPLAERIGGAVADPRVSVVISDVADLVMDAARKGGPHRFDAIILDLYEGPYKGDMGRGDHLYGEGALALSAAALREGGVFGVWSEFPDRDFEKRLGAAGFAVERQKPGRGGRRHVVYIGRLKKAAGPAGHGGRRRR